MKLVDHLIVYVFLTKYYLLLNIMICLNNSNV